MRGAEGFLILPKTHLDDKPFSVIIEDGGYSLFHNPKKRILIGMRKRDGYDEERSTT